jgi:O-acetyl-ADP-ribose deacetylase (regulator of RNase III)
MIIVVKQNLFTLNVDAIVNSANVSLLAGSGICGVIHKNAGKELEDYCKTMGKQEYGSAVITPSFNLSTICDYIIHACGPRYLDGQRGEAELLALTHTSIIKLAIENNFKSIVIPPISTGVYRFPVKEAANIAISSVAIALKVFDGDIDVYFAMKDADKYQVYKDALLRHQFFERYQDRLPNELLTPYFETLFICDNYSNSPLQFGRVSADWKEVFSTQNIESISVITAYNPFSQQDDQEDNEARQSHLYDRLADEGVIPPKKESSFN